jgi:peptide/nickel transport system permease protein
VRARTVGCVVLVAVPLIVALFGPWLTGSAPERAQVPFGPSTWSPFGTDRLGRDVLATALEGGRSLLLVATVTVGWAYLVGFALGMAAAATRRTWLEELIVRPLDVLLCLPTLVIVMVAAVRTNGSGLIISLAVGLTLVAPIARFVRVAASRLVHDPVTDALRLQGTGRVGLYVGYVGRSLLRPVAADLGVRLTAALYVVAAANFLGLGFDTASADWAVAVSANRDGFLLAPWAVLLPAALIVSLVLGVNLLWDELLDRRSAA